MYCPQVSGSSFRARPRGQAQAYKHSHHVEVQILPGGLAVTSDLEEGLFVGFFVSMFAYVDHANDHEWKTPGW